MPAAPRLTDDVIKLIAKIYRQDKKQPAKIVLDKVHEELGQTKWPKISVIQRELKKIKKRDNDVTLQYDAGVENPEAPWHLGLTTKAEYNISPEAVFQIGILQSFCRSRKERPFGTDFPPLTIGEALWVAKLYPYMSFWATDKEVKKEDKNDWCFLSLYKWSKAYAEHEIICKLSGTPFDTTELDERLQAGDYPEVVEFEGEKLPSILFLSRDKIIRRTKGDKE